MPSFERPKTGGREAEIIQDYLNGASTTKIAQKIGVNVTTINNLLSKLDAEIRKPGNYRTKTVGIDKEVVALYASGLSMDSIGKQMNMSFAAIRDVLIRNNIKSRTNSGENHRSWKGGVSKDVVYIRAWKKANRKKRNAEDPLFKLEGILRSRINDFFKRNKANEKLKVRKNNRSFDLLGADKKTIFDHLESQFKKGMTWQNHGSVWHIDHIKPLCSATNEQELLPLFRYTNLQPLWAIDNMKKGGRYAA